ncbi:hypothetical protein CCB80_07895 [Armatimonadetes bacterium Uphvl-Ar1]|nr:hypothetical protein CCB80_07895 [Armatimonadetes bacterium Uphvl-Ar1]
MERQSDGTIRAWVTAPPVEGEANEAVRRLIARTVGVAKNKILLVRGDHGRMKTFRIEGLTRVEIDQLIPGEQL